MTTKPEITMNRSKRVKPPIKYNARATPIIKYFANLKSYLSVLACIMVLRNHKTWYDVHTELKDKLLWDYIQVCNIHTSN